METAPKTPGELMIEKIKAFIKKAQLRGGGTFHVKQIQKNVNGNPVSLSGTIQTIDENKNTVEIEMLWNVEGRSASVPGNPDFDLVENEDV